MTQLEKIQKYEKEIIKQRFEDWTKVKVFPNNGSIDNYLFVNFKDKYVIFYIDGITKRLRCSYINKNDKSDIVKDVPVKKECRKRENMKDLNIPEDKQFFIHCFETDDDLTRSINVLYMYRVDGTLKRFGGMEIIYENDYNSIEKTIDGINFKEWVEKIKLQENLGEKIKQELN